MSSSTSTTPRIRPSDLRILIMHFPDSGTAEEFYEYWFVEHIKRWKEIGDYYRAFRKIIYQGDASVIVLEYRENEERGIPRLDKLKRAMAAQIVRHLEYWVTQSGMMIWRVNDEGVHFKPAA